MDLTILIPSISKSFPFHPHPLQTLKAEFERLKKEYLKNYKFSYKFYMSDKVLDPDDNFIDLLIDDGDTIKVETEFGDIEKEEVEKEESSSSGDEWVDESIKVVKFDNGSEYKGQTNDGKPHGKGIKKWPNGAYYDGEYNMGNKEGEGTMVYPNGDKYEGFWLNDKMHGKGKYTWKNGMIYEGEYKNGNKDGQGKYTWPSGNSFEGTFKDNKRNGEGKEKICDKIFVCTWVDDKKQGKGKVIFSDGKEVEGEWKDDKLVKK